MHPGLSLLTLLPDGEVGGSETYVRGLVGAFARGHGAERTTLLVTDAVGRAWTGPAGRPLFLRTVPSFRYRPGTTRRALALAAGQLAGRMLARGAVRDLDLLHYPLTVPLPAARLPGVVTYHDAQHLAHPGFFSPAERAYRALAYDRAARHAAVVLTPSEFTRRAVVDLLGIDPERVRAVHHGVEHSRFHPAEDQLDERLLAGFSLPRTYVVYPANMWRHKNHERLVEALPRVDPEVSVVLTGSDYGRRDALMATAERIGVSERVRHLGYVRAELVPALYRRATAMIFPSLYEGFGSPPLEAMACGCPTAVARSGSLPEICGPAAFYFDAGSSASIAEAIERVVGDAELRRSLRRAGAAHTARFTWQASAMHHMAAYRAALALGRPG